MHCYPTSHRPIALKLEVMLCGKKVGEAIEESLILKAYSSSTGSTSFVKQGYLSQEECIFECEVLFPRD